MKQRLVENLGLLYVALGFFFSVVVIIFLPYAPAAPAKKEVAVQVTKVSQLTIREQVLLAAYRHGWTGQEWTCLRQLIAIENPYWLPHIKNQESTASGIFQMVRSVSGAMFNGYSIEKQAELGTKYIAYRYGTPCRALHFHYRKGSY
jgi:hypothetical protein